MSTPNNTSNVNNGNTSKTAASTTAPAAAAAPPSKELAPTTAVVGQMYAALLDLWNQYMKQQGQYLESDLDDIFNNFDMVKSAGQAQIDEASKNADLTRYDAYSAFLSAGSTFLGAAGGLAANSRLTKLGKETLSTDAEFEHLEKFNTENFLSPPRGIVPREGVGDIPMGPRTTGIAQNNNPFGTQTITLTDPEKARLTELTTQRESFTSTKVNDPATGQPITDKEALYQEDKRLFDKLTQTERNAIKANLDKQRDAVQQRRSNNSSREQTNVSLGQQLGNLLGQSGAGVIGAGWKAGAQNDLGEARAKSTVESNAGQQMASAANQMGSSQTKAGDSLTSLVQQWRDIVSSMYRG
jgi:hypothetical protein